MERLTEEKQIGPWASLKNKAEAIPAGFNNYDTLMAHMEAVTRLKMYEDLGKTPEELAAALFVLEKSRDHGMEPHDYASLKTVHEKVEKAWQQLNDLIHTIFGEISADRARELCLADKVGRVLLLDTKEPVDIKMNIYNKMEIIEGCTVQILSNTVTGDVSIGWWKGSAEDVPGMEDTDGKIDH